VEAPHLGFPRTPAELLQSPSVLQNICGVTVERTNADLKKKKKKGVWGWTLQTLELQCADNLRLKSKAE